MMAQQHGELVGREVFTSDGRRMGIILAVARSKKVPGRAHAWIDQGKSGKVVPIEALELRKGRVILKNMHSAWIDGVPLYC